MHQARWLVIYILNEREAEFLEDSLRGPIIGMVPRVHFGQLQFSPTVVEYAERCLRTQTFAPAALHEMETELRRAARNGLVMRKDEASEHLAAARLRLENALSQAKGVEPPDGPQTSLRKEGEI